MERKKVDNLEKELIRAKVGFQTDSFSRALGTLEHEGAVDSPLIKVLEASTTKLSQKHWNLLRVMHNRPLARFYGNTSRLK